MTGKGRGEAPELPMKRRIWKRSSADLVRGIPALFWAEFDQIDKAVVVIRDNWKQWYEKKLWGFWRGGNAHE
ncbi:hypothetical protein A6P54_10465 [Bacillus sp. MKU004]|nr:hypothetical protein A6P54_10465 [Bacillus sp. MKU004]